QGDKTVTMATYHDATNLIALLHSSDIQTVRETESFLREHLQIGKDSSGLVCALVDDYIVAQDECTLSLLGLVEDPLDKDLSDRIAEHLRADSSRVHAMNLLGRLVQRQPLWLSSIFSNGLFQTLLRLLLKCDPPADLPFAISGGLLLCTLVPLSAGCLTPHLSDICSLLVRMAAAASRRSVDPPPSPSTAAPPTSVAVTAASTDDLPLLHLHATVYALFNRLYAIFPNYLLDYLRSQLKRNSREFAPLFNSIFRDLLSRVRAHPLLVAGTKDAELQAQRWRRVTSADLMLECGRYCLDLVETTAGEAGIQLAATCRQLEQQQQQAVSEEARDLLASSQLGQSQSHQLQTSGADAGVDSNAAAAPATAAADADAQDELMLQQVLPEDGTFPSKESFLCSSLVRRVRTRLYTHQPGSADPYSAELAVSPIVSASASSAGGQLWLRQLQQQQQSLAHRHRKLPLPGQRRRSLSSPALLDVELASQEQQNHNQQQQQRQIRFSGKENKKAAADVDDGRAQPSNKSNESDRATEQSTDCGASSNGLQLRPPPAVLSRDSQSYAELFLSALPMFPLAKCPECGHVSAGPHLYCQPAAACSQPLPQCLSLAPADLLDAAVICSAELHQLFLEQRQIKQNTGKAAEPSKLEQQLRAQLLQSRCLLMYERHRRELHAQRNRRLLARLVRLRSLEAEAEDARRLGRSKILQRVDELESCLLNERAEWQRERAELLEQAESARRLADERAREAAASKDKARSAADLCQDLRRLLEEERNQRMRAQARLENAELELLACKSDGETAQAAGRQLQEAQRRLLVLGDLLAKSETSLRQRDAQLDELRFLRLHAERLEKRSITMETELDQLHQLLGSNPRSPDPQPLVDDSLTQQAAIATADATEELAQLRRENAELKRRLAQRDLDADLLAVSRIAGPAASDCSCCPLVRMTNSLTG
ncbi:hypothetical protein BOX15_Mlig000736g3, partial [Macrostomum lignano]